MNKGLLLNNNQMYEVYKSRVKHPYFYKLKNSVNSLYFIGTSHVNDPSHPQFSFIKKKWGHFINGAVEKIVFIEGGNWPTAKTEKECIERYGEGSFTKFLAEKASINCISPEPNDEEVFKLLENKFSRDEIMLLFFSRVMGQWGRKKREVGLKEYVTPYLERDKKSSGWKNYDFSIAHMIELHEKIHKKKFDENDDELFYKIYAPTDENVSGAISLIRENHILDQIEKYWLKKHSIFIVYGSGHAIRQEPVLRDYIKGQ